MRLLTHFLAINKDNENTLHDTCTHKYGHACHTLFGFSCLKVVAVAVVEVVEVMMKCVLMLALLRHFKFFWGNRVVVGNFLEWIMDIKYKKYIKPYKSISNQSFKSVLTVQEKTV